MRYPSEAQKLEQTLIVFERLIHRILWKGTMRYVLWCVTSFNIFWMSLNWEYTLVERLKSEGSLLAGQVLFGFVRDWKKLKSNLSTIFNVDYELIVRCEEPGSGGSIFRLRPVSAFKIKDRKNSNNAIDSDNFPSNIKIIIKLYHHFSFLKNRYRFYFSKIGTKFLYWFLCSICCTDFDCDICTEIFVLYWFFVLEFGTKFCTEFFYWFLVLEFGTRFCTDLLYGIFATEFSVLKFMQVFVL